MSQERIRTIERLVERARALVDRRPTSWSRRWSERAEAAWQAFALGGQHPNRQLALLYETEHCALRSLARRPRRPT